MKVLRTSRLRTVGALAGIAAGLLASTEALASSTPLLNARPITIKGERLGPDTCSYRVSATVPPGQRAISVRKLSSNPQTCTMAAEIGTPILTESDLAPVMTQAAQAAGVSARGGTRTSSKGGPQPTPPDGCCGGWNYRQGYVQARTEDPWQADVNWARDWLEFWWGGSTVDGARCWNQFYKLTATGWQGPDSNHYCTYAPGQWSVDGSTYAHFWNNVFCSWPTHIYYNRNLARGQGWGAIQGNTHYVEDGGCTYMLNFFMTVVYTA